MFGYIEKWYDGSDHRVRFVSNEGKSIKQFKSCRYTAIATLEN